MEVPYRLLGQIGAVRGKSGFCHERNIIYLIKNRTYLYKIPADISAAVI